MEKSSKKGKVVLAIGAHPDDVDFGSSGTLLKWVSEGAKVYYLILTNGSKGSENPKMTSDKLIKIRREEQKKAAKILGAKGVFFLNHEDTELHPDLRLKGEIVGYIRKVRPDIVLGYDPNNFYSFTRDFVHHTDHRAGGVATIDAVFPMARDRLTFPHHENLGLKPHKVKELYLDTFDGANYFEDISDFIDKKIEVIRAHKSQIEGKDFVKTIKKRNSEFGKMNGCRYAECFKKITLPG
jgi:LmbE family N-acetylglucosaminyl deacetylase